GRRRRRFLPEIERRPRRRATARAQAWRARATGTTTVGWASRLRRAYSERRREDRLAVSWRVLYKIKNISARGWHKGLQRRLGTRAAEGLTSVDASGPFCRTRPQDLGHHTRLRQEHRRQRALRRAARGPRRRIHRGHDRGRRDRRQYVRLH